MGFESDVLNFWRHIYLKQMFQECCALCHYIEVILMPTCQLLKTARFDGSFSAPWTAYRVPAFLYLFSRFYFPLAKHKLQVKNFKYYILRVNDMVYLHSSYVKMQDIIALLNALSRTTTTVWRNLSCTLLIFHIKLIRAIILIQ